MGYLLCKVVHSNGLRAKVSRSAAFVAGAVDLDCFHLGASSIVASGWG